MSKPSRGPERLSRTWTTFRQTDPAYPALYIAAGAMKPTQSSGRWHVLGEGYAQYLALDALGAWAEYARVQTIRDRRQARETRRDLWLVHVHEHDIADLSGFSKYEECGLPPEAAIDDDHARSQDIARWLSSEGYRGVLSPSAALTGSLNLTLFGPRYEHEVDGEIAAWRNPRPDAFLAVQRIAVSSALPENLITAARFIGAPHGGFEQWCARDRH